MLVTLGGDYLSSSALGTTIVDGQRLAGRQMVDVLNATGIDWATFGNHEFDVTEAQFRARLVVIDEKIVSDPDVDARARGWVTRGFDGFRRQGFAPEAVVADIAEPLDGREATVRNRPGKLTDLIVAAIARDGEVWSVGAKPLDPGRRYVVALPAFLLTGSEVNMDYLTRANPQVHDVRDLRDIRLALIAELK